MTLLRPTLPLLALLLLGGCILPVPVPEGTPGTFEIVLDEGDSCGARGLRRFVGQDESVVLATTFTAPVRVVGPDDAVTMDLNPRRVNFRTDGAGRVVAVDCG